MKIKKKECNKFMSLLIQQRIYRNFSQSHLARLSGLTSAAISMLEKGNRLPSLKAIYLIAKTLDFSIDELCKNIFED